MNTSKDHELRRSEYTFEMAKFILGLPMRIPSANLTGSMQRLLFGLQEDLIKAQLEAETIMSIGQRDPFSIPLDWEFLKER